MLKRRCIIASLTLSVLLGYSSQLRADNIETFPNPSQSVSLAPDQCAMFIWVGYPARPLFISKADEGKAYSAYDGFRSHTLSYKRKPDKFDQFATLDIQDNTRNPMELRLSDPIHISEFVLYETGTMTLAASDDWIRVENAQAVSSCNPTVSNVFVGIDNSLGAFELPDWIKTPEELSEIHNGIDINQVAVSTPAGQPPLIIETPVLFEAVASEAIVPTQPIAASIDIGSNSVTPPTMLIATPDQYTVQLGAYDNPELAQKAWNIFQKDIEYLKNRNHTFQFLSLIHI